MGSKSLSLDSEGLVENGRTSSDGLERNSEGFIGVLGVYIHEARDIHNICIYQNQDVYAKLFLTSNPDRAVSTRIINGGGRNPVFDENVRLNVEKIESSLKVEVWMLSRVRNYLEDQLLGFALVPLRDVLIKNGKPAQEFSLSSSDLYHVHAGFVLLTLTYNGSSPEVLEIPASPSHVLMSGGGKDSGDGGAIPCDMYDKIEFVDPEILKENEKMATEYFAIPCSQLDCISTEQSCPDGHDGQTQITSSDEVVSSGMEFGCQGTTSPTASQTAQTTSDEVVSSGVGTPPSTLEVPKADSAPVPSSSSSVSQASSVPGSQNPLGNTNVSEKADGAPAEAPAQLLTQPLIDVSLEQESKVVQEDIVQMYMKSMQQFTEALAKMKLPLDMTTETCPPGNETANASSGNSSSDEKSKASSKGSEPSPRVFYGSRAFF